MDTYLTFLLREELFAVSVSKVLEVLQKQQITRVPKTPDHILGIINFRGDILPVADTRRKFGLPATETLDKQIVIVFEIGQNGDRITIAATADAVKDVIEIQENEIKPVPELGLNYDVKYIKGAVRRNESFILLLDVEKIFSAKDLATVNTLEKQVEVIEN
jgi:purine-binding chemotaxis protein CheW